MRVILKSAFGISLLNILKMVEMQFFAMLLIGKKNMQFLMQLLSEPLFRCTHNIFPIMHHTLFQSHQLSV